MKPWGLARPSCTVSGTLPAGPRSVTYSRQPFDRYSISSSSELRAWWTSQSTTGPEYIRGKWSPFHEGRADAAPPCLLICLTERFDLIRPYLVRHGVMQDLDRLVDRCIRIGGDLTCRLTDALNVRGVPLLLRRHRLRVGQRVAKCLVERRCEVQEAVRLRNLLARGHEARAVRDEDLVVVLFHDLKQSPRQLRVLCHLGDGHRPATERARAARSLALGSWDRHRARDRKSTR